MIVYEFYLFYCALMVHLFLLIYQFLESCFPLYIIAFMSMSKYFISPSSHVFVFSQFCMYITIKGGKTSCGKRGWPTIIVHEDVFEWRRLARERHNHKYCLKKKGVFCVKIIMCLSALTVLHRQYMLEICAGRIRFMNFARWAAWKNGGGRYVRMC